MTTTPRPRPDQLTPDELQRYIDDTRRRISAPLVVQGPAPAHELVLTLHTGRDGVGYEVDGMCRCPYSGRALGWVWTGWDSTAEFALRSAGAAFDLHCDASARRFGPGARR